MLSICLCSVDERAALGSRYPAVSHQFFHLVFDSGNELEEERQAGVAPDKLSEQSSLGYLEI